jgi:hypothetical protein
MIFPEATLHVALTGRDDNRGQTGSAIGAEPGCLCICDQSGRKSRLA